MGAEGDERGARGDEDLLQQLPLFRGLPAAVRTRLAASASVVRVPAGEWLFRTGDAGDALYALRSGRLEVVAEQPPPERVLRVLQRGASLGELALLSGGRRTASVRARRDSELVRLARERFDELLESDARFAAALTRSLAEQLRSGPAPPRPEPARVVTVVPLHPDVPLGAVVDAVVATFGTYGSVSRLDGGELAGLPQDDLSSAFGRLLDAHEQAHDRVVLVARHPAARDAWTRFCLRQADRVVGLVEPAAGPPPPQLGEDLRTCDLAFLGWGCDAVRLAPWFARFEPHAHHLLRPGPTFGATLERMARRLAGRSLGVVLSGGGARGLAHIGVLAALVGAGWEVDRVGGTSIGALVGALFARGLTPGEIRDLCWSELVLQHPLSDYTVPRHGLIKARKATAMLHRLFGDAVLEELPRPMFAVSADLVSGEEVVHRRGPVVVAVGVSMALPGLVPPVPDVDRLLVDGGVLNNLPVDVMAATGEGPVVAVDVMRRPRSQAQREAEGPGRWAGRRRPAERPLLPNIVETLARASVLGGWRKAEANRRLADAVVTPDLTDVGLLEFRRLDVAVEAGRRAGEELVASLPAMPAAARLLEVRPP